MKAINKSTTKIIEILQLFDHHAGLYFQEIVEQSGLPKTSVHRLLCSLQEMGFIEKKADRTYVLGMLFLHYGQLVKERLDVRQVALPVMVDLRDQISEAVNLIVRDEHEAIYIDKVDTLRPVRVYTRIGRRAPLYAGACPRILLTYMDDECREEYLRQVQLVPVGSGTITDKGQLQKVLFESKQCGYSVSHNELEDGSAAVQHLFLTTRDRLSPVCPSPDPSHDFNRRICLALFHMYVLRHKKFRKGWVASTR